MVSLTGYWGPPHFCRQTVRATSCHRCLSNCKRIDNVNTRSGCWFLAKVLGVTSIWARYFTVKQKVCVTNWRKLRMECKNVTRECLSEGLFPVSAPCGFDCCPSIRSWPYSLRENRQHILVFSLNFLFIPVFPVKHFLYEEDPDQPKNRCFF